MSNVISFENLVVEGDFKEKGSEAESPEKRLDMILIKNALCQLTDREKNIIVLRYYKDMTQQQIAKKMGISQVQVDVYKRQL